MGRIWAGFGPDLGWIWAGFGLDLGWIWAGFGPDLGRIDRIDRFGLGLGWVWVVLELGRDEQGRDGLNPARLAD